MKSFPKSNKSPNLVTLVVNTVSVRNCGRRAERRYLVVPKCTKDEENERPKKADKAFQIGPFIRAVVVVKWSACSPSTPTIRVQIPLKPAVFL